MKTSIPKLRWIKSTISIAVLIAARSAIAISTTGGAVTTSVSDAAPNQPHSPAPYSTGVAEILKMADAKVEGSVIVAYVDSSPFAYNPNASEIIMLRDRGVPSEVLAAMLKHGAEMRARTMAAAPPPPQPYQNTTAPYATTAPNAESPDYAYSSPTAYPDYAYPSSAYYNYSYPYYGYSYPYYGYSYPWYGYWPAYYGYYPYHYYNHYHNHYPYHSGNHFGHGNHLTASRGNFNGRVGTVPSRGSAFRTMGGAGAHPVSVAGHAGGFRGSVGGGGFRGGGGSTARAGGSFGGHGGGRGR